MKDKLNYRVILDGAMIILLPILMAYNLTGNLVHEVLGMAIFVLFALHLFFNRYWFRSLSAKPKSLSKFIHDLINLLLLLVMIMMFTSALMISHTIFPFADYFDPIFSRSFHIGMTTWGFILMSIHLGLHWKNIQVQILKKLQFRKFYIIKIANFIIILFLFVHGISAFLRHDTFNKLILNYTFSYWDFKNESILFFADQLGIMVLFSILSHYLMKFLIMKAK